MARIPKEQSGNEAARPAPAPAGTRFGLALFGVLMSTVGVLVFAALQRWWAVAGFGALACVAMVDTVAQARRMRRRRRR